MGILDRPGCRLENCLRSLCNQTLPLDSVDITLCDMGSAPTAVEQLKALAETFPIRLVLFPRGATGWNRSLALNAALKQADPSARYVLFTDVDMIFAPNFIETVLRAQLAFRGAFVCGNWLMLPPPTVPSADTGKTFQELKATGTWYKGGAGSGGFQSWPRHWIEKVHGFDERFAGWGCQDLDLKTRSLKDGVPLVIVDGMTSLLHQWHEHETARAEREGSGDALQKMIKMKTAILRDDNSIVRNPNGWGRLPEDAIILEPRPHTLKKFVPV